MDRVTQAKLALVVMAGIFFGGSLYTGQDWPRIVAIALLVVALALRLFRPRRPE